MSFSRRTFLLGAGSGLSLLVLTACTDSPPAPTSSPVPEVPLIPKPSNVLRSNWGNDPYSRGATSYLRVGGLPQARETLRESLLDRVFLAGEAMSDDPGTVRGAIDSGKAAARQVLDVSADGDRIAIVGAGAAGAEAARLLSIGGADVVVIEARDRTGGRIDSRTTPSGSTVELGAWRFTRESDDELINVLSRAGVEVLPLEGGTAHVDEDASVTELPADDPQRTEVLAALTAALESAREQPRDLSVEAAAQQIDIPAESEVLLQQLLADLAVMTGAAASDSTTWFLTPAFGEALVVPESPLVALIDNALDGIEPALSSVVTAVFYDEDSVSLRLGTGESFSVDRVILTVPLGVLQEQAIEFDPPLPLLHRSALDQLAVGHVEIVALEFESPFWDTEAAVWYLDGDDEGIRLWVNLLPITGENVLLGVVGGEEAVALSKLDDGDMLAMARRSLAPFS